MSAKCLALSEYVQQQKFEWSSIHMYIYWFMYIYIYIYINICIYVCSIVYVEGGDLRWVSPLFLLWLRQSICPLVHSSDSYCSPIMAKQGHVSGLVQAHKLDAFCNVAMAQEGRNWGL